MLDTAVVATSYGSPWLTALLIAILLAVIVGAVWFARHRGPGAKNRR